MARLSRLALALLLAAALPAGAQEGLRWRPVDPANLVIMQLPAGPVVIELNPAFAPKTVERFLQLVEDDFYRGLSFYRVIEGFVAQAGDESDLGQPGSLPGLPPEFEREFDADALPWTTVQKGDPFATETGFIDGFAAGRDKQVVWLAHCPGVVAMARGDEPDSGTTDFYIVIGQAPRYLDRNLTVFGRVIAGMDAVQSVERGPWDNNGVILDDLSRTRILRMQLGADVPEAERHDYLVMDTTSPGFTAMLAGRRDRDQPFFHHRPPKVLDVCQVPVATRIEKPGSPGRSPLAD